MNPPHLLLDIDGVLIPFPADDGSTPADHVHHQVVPTGRSSEDPVAVWLNPLHGRMINDVITTRLLRPVWCTSWRQDAPELIGRLLGLTPFPYLGLPRPIITTSHPNGYLWKRDHVDAWLGGAPAVWIDDDFTSLDHEWAAQRTTAVAPTLLIQPDSYIGLLPEHLLAALTWAATLPDTRGAVTRSAVANPTKRARDRDS